MNRRRTILSWSTGKDSAWTLHVMQQQPDHDVLGLVTTFNCNADRVAMHAVRRELAEAQAKQLDLPLWAVDLSWPCANSVYEELMGGFCRRAAAEHMEAIAFGDLFLEDIRAYRERQLEGTGLEPVFPLWKLPTPELARDMIRGGVKAKITCVDPQKLDRRFAGRDYDVDFLNELPGNVDPCGENGEFHTFVYEAPVFRAPIRVTTGAIVERDGFVFADVLPA
jgi:uncharacterized protein (TIGR00290 family)